MTGLGHEDRTKRKYGQKRDLEKAGKKPLWPTTFGGKIQSAQIADRISKISRAVPSISTFSSCDL